MKNVTKALLLILTVIIFLMTACSKYEEPAPFFDGLFLDYKIGEIKRIFNFNIIDNNSFKIVKTDVDDVLGNTSIELFIDGNGRVYKSNSSKYEGKYSLVWIPVHQMKIGDTFDDGYKVLRKDKWKKWEVLVIKNPIYNEEQYFELNTGYLVGVKGSVEVNLVNTNADIPTVE
ncbi:MAG: hypothetical protein AMK71_03350 [Nitrospira bacterium SG8_35_4]|nr:MAG: hypothetical protein AMK71_03350 [Nitrospira bacterium SG8_35_4]